MISLWHFFINNRHELYTQTIQHVGLTFIALLIALLIGLPLGILLTRFKRLSGTGLGAVGIIQTIPSLALLGFLIPVFGIGPVPAIVALFLYALLPIVRNTFAGIDEVDDSVIESALGMGLTDSQILTKVQLPLAIPVIFAGIRTATVINVGIATLCALIGAGGLGKFIFRGIALNNVTMILAGAIPAALLALAFDFILGLLQRYIYKLFKPILIGGIMLLVLTGTIYFRESIIKKGFTLGLTPEFTERADGYRGLKQTYDLNPATVEMNSSLLYQALRNKRVDAIIGYSTDGRIDAFNLRVLKDDKHYFPPYRCAPLVRDAILKKYPELGGILNMLAGRLNDETMRHLNYLVDQQHERPATVARNFLHKNGFRTSVTRNGNPDIIVGGKIFTEQYILDQMYKSLIENYSPLTVGIKSGLGGTKIVFDALVNNEIDLYPEYTGTGLYVLLKPDSTTVDSLNNNSDAIYRYVKKQTEMRYHLTWLSPLGYNNTYALMMRKREAKRLGISSISDLSAYLGKQNTAR